MDGSLPNSPTLSSSDTSSNEEGIRPFAEDHHTDFKIQKVLDFPDSPRSHSSEGSCSDLDSPNRHHSLKIKGN